MYIYFLKFSTMTISIEIGMGELFDRFSILTIKKERIQEPSKLKNVENEYNYLKVYIDELPNNLEVEKLYYDLLNVNTHLWEIEDELRELEKDDDFGDEFIKNARSVYKLNDKRAAIKKQINLIYNSKFVEEKSYK